jgi:UDP-galactopyranose mutase
MSEFDLVICGAGPVGCTIANRAAHELGWNVLVVEKRGHVAGNCYDELHPSGVLIHRYGPHYFRTNSRELLDFLSQYTDWVPGNYIVKSSTRGQLFPFPINLLTLEQFFNRKFTAEEAQDFLASLAQTFESPQNSEEFVLSRVGRELYEAFYKGYTQKQWGVSPRELDASVCGRIPLRFNNDCRYVDHQFQVTPKQGFTRMFQRMLEHPRIQLLLQADFRQVKKWARASKAVIYTGAVDEYFDFTYGKLPWRSLEFDFVEYPVEFRQPCVQINYPNDFEYTRTVEIKHVTQQQTKNTVISYEYSRAVGDPYYPVPARSNEELYQRYRLLAEQEEQSAATYFVGRLATYRYYNTDQVIEEALKTFARLKERFIR